MGRFSGAFDEAEKEFDEEFAGKLVKSDFSEKALAELTPEGGPDREAMTQFIAEAKASANAQAAKDAWIKLGGKVSVKLLKIAKKVVTSGLAALLLLLLASHAVAQPTEGGIPDAPPKPLSPLKAFEQEVPGGPLGVLGRFIEKQEAIVGVSVSPINVMDLRTEAITLLRGPAYGEHGLSLHPGRHKKGAKAYIEIDYGGRFKKDEKVAFRALAGVHPANIVNLILEDFIKSDRLRIPPLPENIVGGPMFRIPLPGDPEPWTWRNGFRLVVAWLFG